MLKRVEDGSKSRGRLYRNLKGSAARMSQYFMADTGWARAYRVKKQVNN